MSTVVLLLEIVVVVGAITMGTRTGGVGIGIWGGAGVFVMVFVLGNDPGSPPVDAVLILLAVVLAASVMQAAGGIDWMVAMAARALRARPQQITYVAPLVTWMLGSGVGTGNVIYPVLPIIFDVAHRNRIRPARPMTMAVVAIVLSLVCSPASAAMAALITLTEVPGIGIGLGDVLKVTIPSVLIGIVVGATVTNHLGAELDEDPEYLRRVEAGSAPPLDGMRGALERTTIEVGYTSRGRLAALVFLAGIAAIVTLGLFPGLRPDIGTGDAAEPVGTPLVIQAVMFAVAALIVTVCRPDVSEVPGLSVFQAGITSAMALFGVAWLADTFIRAHEDDIVATIGNWVVDQPWVFAAAIFITAALTLSQSTTVRAIVPIGLAAGLSPMIVVASLPAVGGALTIAGATGQAVAASNFDASGTTSLGTKVIDSSFAVPMIATVVPAVLAGLAISQFI